MEVALKDKIKILRQIKNLTQLEMAEKLELPVTSYQQIENGDTKIISKNLDKILEKFDLNFLEFLSIGEKGIVCLINEYSLNHNTTIISGISGSNNIGELPKEIQRLEQIIDLQQKRISDLETMIDLLKDKLN